MNFVRWLFTFNKDKTMLIKARIKQLIFSKCDDNERKMDEDGWCVVPEILIAKIWKKFFSLEDVNRSLSLEMQVFYLSLIIELCSNWSRRKITRSNTHTNQYSLLEMSRRKYLIRRKDILKHNIGNSSSWFTMMIACEMTWINLFHRIKIKRFLIKGKHKLKSRDQTFVTLSSSENVSSRFNMQ